jgi:membrane-bound lytic murein transglycosylase D
VTIKSNYFNKIGSLSIVISSVLIATACQVTPQTPSAAAAAALPASEPTLPTRDAEPVVEAAVDSDEAASSPTHSAASEATTEPRQMRKAQTASVANAAREQPQQESDQTSKSTEGTGVSRGIGVDQPDDLWERIRQDLSWQETESVRIDKARNNYLRQDNYMPMVSERADQYLYYIVEEVEKRNMPMEIALIPMIESALDPFARGPSGAAGLWQIMPKTGAHLGLDQDSWYDGRQAVRDSTQVALDYLESLYEQFGEDWFLALAAYNAGAGRVSRAQQANKAKGLSTDYWSLNLPRHTTYYVPKIIALAQIVAEPERFDVVIPEVQNAPAFEVVDTGTQLQLAKAAQLAEVDIDTLRALNPGQLRETTSPDRPPEILLPIGSADIFEYNIAKLSPDQLVEWKTYKIKPGDNLGQIAQKFDIDVEVLQEINRIRGSMINAGDYLKIPGAPSIDATIAAASDGNTKSQGYEVREGDSLYRIAGRFKVSVDQIIAWNDLDRRAYLKPGQQLKLYPKGG